jgi:hypothetical protein
MGFKTVIPASEWPQTRTLDRAATGIVIISITCKYIFCYLQQIPKGDKLVNTSRSLFALNLKAE